MKYLKGRGTIMKSIRTHFLSLLALVTLLVGSNAFAEEYKIRWVLAHDPVKAFDNAVSYFKETVEKETNGAVKVETLTVKQFNNGNRMSETQIYDRLKKGDFEMCQTFGTFLGSKSPAFWAFDLPFLFRDYDHAEKVITGPIGREILASLDKEQLHGMAITYSGGFRVIPSINKKLTKIEDFQGVNLRIPRFASVAGLMYEKLGAVPMPMSPEIASLNQASAAHRVDGLETTLPRFWELENRQLSRVVNVTEHSLYVTALVINKKFFDNLPEKYRAIVQKAAERAAALERQDAIQLGEELKKEIAANGLTVVNMSKAERERFRKASSEVYSSFEKMIGKDLIAKIRATK